MPHIPHGTSLAIGLCLCLCVLTSACQPEDQDPPGQTTNAEPGNNTTPPPEDESLPFQDDPSARMWRNSASWYPQDYLELDSTISGLLDEHGASPKRKALGIIAPHAGVANSGHVAAAAYGRVEVPDLVILLAPKHHNEGASPAAWNEGPILVPGHALATRGPAPRSRRADLREILDQHCF